MRWSKPIPILHVMLDVSRHIFLHWLRNDPGLPGPADRGIRRWGICRRVSGFEDQAARRLSVLNAARSVDTLRALRSNRLEVLRGDRAGQYSIRINRQWRICFSWPDGQAGPSDVEIVDYH